MLLLGFRANIHIPKGKGEKTMKTRFYIGGKKVTKKAAAEAVGKESLEKKIKIAKQNFREDPYIQSSFCLGRECLTICFE